MNVQHARAHLPLGIHASAWNGIAVTARPRGRRYRYGLIAPFSLMGVKVADHVGRSARDKYSRPRHVM